MSLGETPRETYRDVLPQKITSAGANPSGSNPRGSLGWSGLNPSEQTGDLAWEDSELYNDWAKATQRGTPDDFVILITASSKTGISGTGKTTLFTFLGKQTDHHTDSLEDTWGAEEKATLDAGDLAYEVTPTVEPRSAVGMDELQGAPGTTGLDARRAMKQEAIDMVSGILANRDDQYTIILSGQHTKFLDPRLFLLVDAWLMIKKGPNERGGPLATHHRIHIEDYDFGDPKVKTPAVQDFTWPKIPHDDPDYQALEEKKQQAKKRRGSDDVDDSGEIPKRLRDEKIRRLSDAGVAQKPIAESFDLDQSTVSRIISEDA